MEGSSSAAVSERMGRADEQPAHQRQQSPVQAGHGVCEVLLTTPYQQRHVADRGQQRQSGPQCVEVDVVGVRVDEKAAAIRSRHDVDGFGERQMTASHRYEQQRNEEVGH